MSTFNDLESQITHYQQNLPYKANTADLSQLFAQGLPTRKTESWKYTNINSLFDSSFSLDSRKVEINISDYRLEGFDNIFIVNGQLHDQSDKTIFDISSFDESIIEKNKHFLKDDFALLLQKVNLHVGINLTLKANNKSNKPIVIFHIEDDKEKTLKSFQTTICLKENSSAQILEVYINKQSSQSLYNYASAISLEAGAHLLHIHHQTFEQETSFFNNICSQVAKDARYESFTTTIGGAMTRSNICVDLNEEGAQAVVHGVYTLQGQQHSDCNSFVHHKAPHTHSEQLYKGIMNDQSRGVFTGLIKVAKDAQLITSSQLNKNLLLSTKAQAFSRPQLEIFADDVKCSHGSTTGQLDEDELFYFLSRGVRAEKAYMMLARAFTYDVLLKIPNLLVRKYLQDDITFKFEQHAFKGQNA